MGKSEATGVGGWEKNCVGRKGEWVGDGEGVALCCICGLSSACGFVYISELFLSQCYVQF